MRRRSPASGHRDAGAEPVIPARSNRTQPRPHDKVLYKERDLVERFSSRLKQVRRVATRCDKLPANYEGFVQLVAITILLQRNRHQSLSKSVSKGLGLWRVWAEPGLAC